MSIVLITGDHPRHKFFANSLINASLVKGWVCEKREEFVPVAPNDITSNQKKLFKKHFVLREKVENDFFNYTEVNRCKKMNVALENLNSESTAKFIRELEPSLVLSYGCHKLSKELIDKSKSKFWNTHGGLSPRYRGVITHFWPSYFLEPQMTGITLHETTSKIDGGDIIFQSIPEMVSGDGLHILAARSVMTFTKLLEKRLMKLDFDNLPSGVSQKSAGRIFKASDWRPEHLEVIYDKYEDKVVDLYTSGSISRTLPELISVI
tara:strand:+ start:367 stop:1158 length:792 start_codon:yes stop_codon:yes gene_type:complete